MPKISVADLDNITSRVRKATNIRDGAGRAKITVHMGTCGIAAGARTVMTAVLEEIEKQKYEDIIVTTSGCAGLCSREPMVTVEIKSEAPVKYGDVTAEGASKIVTEHIGEGKIVESFAIASGSESLASRKS
jgi:NADP-reducing hydrogenase subunit HndB